MTFNRRAGGWAARLHGSQFEQSLELEAACLGMQLIRIPDGCKQTKMGLVRVKSPFDYMLAFQGKTAFFDAKTRDTKTFPHSAVNQNQLRHLLGLERHGCAAGYLVKLQGNQRVFFSARVLHELEPRASLKIEQGIVIGSLTELCT